MHTANFCSWYSCSCHLEQWVHLIIKFASKCVRNEHFCTLMFKVCFSWIHSIGTISFSSYRWTRNNWAPNSLHSLWCSCSKWESAKEQCWTLSGLEKDKWVCGNMLGKFLNVFNRRSGEGKATSETFQLKTMYFDWEMLWRCLLGAIVQRWCSALCSLTRLDVPRLLACRSVPCGRYVSDKTLTISVGSSSLVKEPD